MNTIFKCGELTVIAGRPGTGKTRLLNKIIKKYELHDFLLLNFENTPNLFELIKTAVSHGKYEYILIDDLSFEQKKILSKSLKTLKLFASYHNIAIITTLTLSRKYMKNGSLRYDAVKTDLAKNIDRLLIIDRPCDLNSHDENTVIYSGDNNIIYCNL